MGSGQLRQFETAFASSFGCLVMAMLFVWPSYTTHLYTSQNTTILSRPMTATEESLVGSLPSLGAMVGTAVVGPIIETFGRKLGGISIALPFIVSWALIGVAKSSILILIARFLSGVSGGAYLVSAPIFVSEVADDSIRGFLASLTVLLYGVGALLSYGVGWFLSYSMIIWVNMALSVICCLLYIHVVESPVFLLKKNREEEARASIAVYRGASPKSMVVQDELTRLKQQISPAVELLSVNDTEKEKPTEPEKEKLNPEDCITEPIQKQSAWKALFTSPSSRKAFLVVSTVISMQVIMGIVPVQVYAKQVFQHADPEKADLYSVIFALVLLLGSFVTSTVADKAGRRILIIGSSTMVAVCMAALGFLLQTNAAPAWVTVVMILLYCFFFMTGAGSIPYVLLAEVFVPEVQAFASTIIIEWVWFLNFLILAAFTYLNSLIGIHGTFYIFAINGVINAVLSFFLVPETKGLSTAQIQECFLRSRRK